MVTTESVSSLGREARGPKAAGRNELQVADFIPFPSPQSIYFSGSI